MAEEANWLDEVAAAFQKPDSGGAHEQYRDQILKYAKADDVDPGLIESIVRAESGGKKLARSGKGAAGLMQVMGPTAAEVAKELGMKKYDLHNPDDNLRIGIRYIKNMLTQQQGDVQRALAAYNAGPGNVKKYGGVPPFPETQRYVKKVQGYYKEKRPDEFYNTDWLNDVNPQSGKPTGSFEGASADVPKLSRNQ